MGHEFARATFQDRVRAVQHAPCDVVLDRPDARKRWIDIGKNEQVTTSLSEEGNRLLLSLTEDSVVMELRMGAAMLNHYLSTGKRLPLSEAIASLGESR